VWWIAFCGILCVAGVVQGLLGFGYALVSLALLPWLFEDVRPANLVVSFATLAPLTALAWNLRAHLDWRAARDSLAGAALGLPIGLVAFNRLPPVLLAQMTGAILLVVAVDELRRRPVIPHALNWSAPIGFGIGAASGFLAGSVGMPGPPLVAYAGKQAWSPQRFKAFTTAFFTVVALAKAVAVLAGGFVDEWILGLALLGLPCTWIGQRFGVYAFRFVQPQLFRRLVFGVLLLLALFLLFPALKDGNFSLIPT
jgi:uncharacterized membrane protein YfcA